MIETSGLQAPEEWSDRTAGAVGTLDPGSFYQRLAAQWYRASPQPDDPAAKLAAAVEDLDDRRCAVDKLRPVGNNGRNSGAGNERR